MFFVPRSIPKILFPVKKPNIFKLYQIFGDFLFPYFCLSCNKFLKYGYLCENCLKEIDFCLKIFCPKCKRRSPITENIYTICCSNLIKSLITFCNYEVENIKLLIQLGKIDGFYKVFEFLGYLIFEEIKNSKLNFKDYYISYVPMYYLDEKRRGFNQAKILAETLSKNIQLKIWDGLIKIKPTKLQTELGYKDRIENVKFAFKCKDIPPLNIILIDDVITTGATAFECAKTLREQGTKNIILITIAT